MRRQAAGGNSVSGTGTGTGDGGTDHCRSERETINKVIGGLKLSGLVAICGLIGFGIAQQVTGREVSDVLLTTIGNLAVACVGALAAMLTRTSTYPPDPVPSPLPGSLAEQTVVETMDGPAVRTTEAEAGPSPAGASATDPDFGPSFEGGSEGGMPAAPVMLAPEATAFPEDLPAQGAEGAQGARTPPGPQRRPGGAAKRQSGQSGRRDAGDTERS